MQYTKLGERGPQVSRIAFGNWSLRTQGTSRDPRRTLATGGVRPSRWAISLPPGQGRSKAR